MSIMLKEYAFALSYVNYNEWRTNYNKGKLYKKEAEDGRWISSNATDDWKLYAG